MISTKPKFYTELKLENKEIPVNSSAENIFMLDYSELKN